MGRAQEVLSGEKRPRKRGWIPTGYVRAVVCDLEGVLVPTNNAPLDLRALTELQVLNARSRTDPSVPAITLCTGRQIPFVEAMCRVIGCYLPAVCENGAALFIPEAKDYVNHPLITDEVERRIDECRHLILDELLLRFPGARLEPGKEFSVSLNPPPGRAIEDWAALVADLFAARQFEVRHSTTAVDITPAGIDKGAGIVYLSELTGISLSEMAAVGDSNGDLPMLERVGCPVAPHDAMPEVKKLAAFVSPHTGVHVVRHLIDRCVAANSQTVEGGQLGA